MLLKQLQYFCAVARLGSFTKAAEECYISQSAVSQQVKALEADLGVALIERRGRGFRLTRAGELVAARGAELVSTADQLRFDVTHLDEDPPELRVGYLNRYEGWEVAGAIAAFAQRHPNVKVSAESSSHDGLYEAVLRGELDILVNDRRRALSDAFENRFLFTGYNYVEASEASEFAWRESVTVDDLRGATCILIAAGGQRDVERDYYRGMLNFECDFLFADTLEQARMMVAGNRGFLPLERRERTRRSGTVLRRIPLMDAAGAHLQRDYYAFWPKARTSAFVKEFADILEGLVGE